MMKGALLLVVLLLANYCHGIRFDLEHHKRTVTGLKGTHYIDIVLGSALAQFRNALTLNVQ